MGIHSKHVRRRLVAFALLVAPTSVYAAIDCAGEHFVSHGNVLPTHAEALDECRRTQAVMTDDHRGGYELAGDCHDVAPPGHHGDWHHGIIALDVRERVTGEVHTVEGLWMCKPRAVDAAP